MHPALEAVKAEFDKVEESLLDKISRGRVTDWADYRYTVGQIHECREGRERALEAVKKILEEA